MVWQQTQQGKNDMTEERKAELRAWIISVFIHLIIVCILAGIGVFAMNKKDMAQDLAEVVWIENSGGGSSGSSGSSTISEAAAAAPSIETSVVIPEKEHKDKEKNTEVSPNPQSKAVSINKAASTDMAGAGNANQGNTSQGTGNGIGSGNDAGEGIGYGTGDGAGDGVGNGGGIGSRPSERAEAVCTHKAAPKYPNRMKEQGIGGRVVLEIYVNPDDSIESVEIISSSGHGALDEAAINAAYRCRFAMNGLWGRYTLSYVFEVVDDDW